MDTHTPDDPGMGNAHAYGNGARSMSCARFILQIWILTAIDDPLKMARSCPDHGFSTRSRRILSWPQT